MSATFKVAKDSRSHVLPRKRFDQARPFLMFGVVLAVWLVAPVALKSFARASFFEFHAPLNFAAARVRDIQDFWSLRTRSKEELIEAGRDLGRLTAEYETTVRDNAVLRAENDRLRSMFQLPGYAEFDEVVARVELRDLSGWWQRIQISKGSLHGLKVNCPVIFAGGVVGKVVEVHAYTSVVDLVTSPTFRISASFEADDRVVTYQGGINLPFRAPLGAVEYVPIDIFASATTPRRLVTAGLGGIFPPGLAIGQVIELTRSADALFNSGQVHLDPRLSEVREVTVLVRRSPAPASTVAPR